MSSHRRVTFAVLAAALLLMPRPVRGQDVDGTWITEVPVRMSNENGQERVEETAVVTITLARHGEAIRGTWQLTSPEGSPMPAPRALNGALRDGRLTLVDTTEAFIRRDDGPTMAVQMVNTIELSVEGDALTGWQSARSLDGEIETPRRAFSARRES